MHDSPNIAILLTATINVGATPDVAHVSSSERRADYARGLAPWLAVPGLHVVLCENSGADLEAFRDAPRAHGSELELIGFHGSDVAVLRGKGAGEAELIAHAFASSSALRDADLVVKVTGRLVVRNTEQFLRGIRAAEGVEVFADLRLRQRISVADSRVFAARPSFYFDRLLKRADRMDDPAGSYFEHVLAQAVHAVAADGEPWDLLPVYPEVVGRSGTTGDRYRSGLLIRLAHHVEFAIRRRIVR
ncbi:MAG: hypothetical protein JWN72_634 [Thermoleophilia bacterium]|nr:hypothetical protein [Thermoleophilia bacterium]